MIARVGEDMTGRKSFTVKDSEEYGVGSYELKHAEAFLCASRFL